MGMQTEIGDACSWCGETLTAEEFEYPQSDGNGDPVCETCWDDEHNDDCERCGQRVAKTDLSFEPGALIGVWRSAEGSVGRVRRGYYRVKSWPFYVDTGFGGFFYSDALERLGPLDKEGRTAGRWAEAMAGSMCPGCHPQVGAWLDAWAAR